jgi:integrase
MKVHFKLIKVRIQSKREIVLFRTEPYQPILVPFIFQILQLKAKALATTKNKLNAIKNLYEYFQSELDYDIDEILINRRFEILKSELPSFINWLLYSETFDGFYSRKANLNHISEYLTWALNRYSKSRSESRLIKDLFESYSRSLPSPKPSENDWINKEDSDLLLKYSSPLFPFNPFRPQNQLRNYIIINIFLSTGIRISELLKLKSLDIHQSSESYYIEVINRENEEDDSRSDEPGLKNNQSQRVISITDELYNLIQNYIIEFRRPVRLGKKIKLSHGYLLTSERGRPLSKTVIYDLLRQLKEKIIKDGHSFSSDLTPHSFRHLFAENFLENLIEVQGLDENRAKDELRTIGGWSLNSDMPTFYARRYIAKSANAHNMFRISNSLKKSNG